MFLIGIRKDNIIVDIDNKVLTDHVLKDFAHGSYHVARSIAVALLHEATVIIYHVGEEGRVLFRMFFHSDIVVPIC